MTTQRTPRLLSVAGLLTGLIIPLSLLVCAPGASAAELTLTDRAGDNARPGLDIVATDLDNNDYRLTTTIDFKTHRSGTVVLGLKAQQGGLLRFVNKHDADGSDRTWLMSDSGRLPCRGLLAHWDVDDAEITLSAPSTCLWEGNYGAVRPWVLTEGLHSGSDVDLSKTTKWTPRG